MDVEDGPEKSRRSAAMKTESRRVSKGSPKIPGSSTLCDLFHFISFHCFWFILASFLAWVICRFDRSCTPLRIYSEYFVTDKVLSHA